MGFFNTDACFSTTETKRDNNGAVYSKDGKKIYKGCFAETFQVPNGVEIICDRAFQPEEKTDRSIIRKIILPESVKAIGGCAFANNEGLEEINIPSSVQYISCNNPFGGCFSLNKILIQSENYLIENDILYSSDYKLLIGALHSKDTNRTITINPNTEVIGANSFWHLKNLSQIVFPRRLKEMGKAAFKWSSIQTVDLSETQLVHISEECFQSGGLQVIIFPKSLKKIETNAFYFCHLKKLDLSNTKVKAIGEYAFSNCNLTQLILSPCLEEIDSSAFSNAFSKQFKQNVTIPSFVTYIGNCAFNDDSIKRVDIESSNLLNIGEDIFDGTNLETIRCKATGIMNHPNIRYYKEEHNVEIILLDKKVYLQDDNITLKLETRKHINNDIDDYYWQERIDKIFGVGSVKVDIVQFRLPVYGENFGRHILGACINNVVTLQPKYDSIDTLIAQGKDVYFLSKIETQQGCLYELFYGSQSIYVDFTCKEIKFGDTINACFCGQKIKIGNEIGKTYYGEEIKKKFKYRTSEEYLQRHLRAPLQFVTLIKGEKYSIYKSGKCICDYEYDTVSSIDNNIECLNYYAVKMTFPKVSMRYLKVGKRINNTLFYGVINETGEIVIPVKYKELDACRSFILADDSLYVLKNNFFSLLNDHVDLSSPVVVYGGYAFFKALGCVCCYDTNQVQSIKKDYVIEEGEEYNTVFVIEEMKIEEQYNWHPKEISNEEYQKEMDQMYRDAFDNNPELEWNID